MVLHLVCIKQTCTSLFCLQKMTVITVVEPSFELKALVLQRILCCHYSIACCICVLPVVFCIYFVYCLLYLFCIFHCPM